MRLSKNNLANTFYSKELGLNKRAQIEILS